MPHSSPQPPPPRQHPRPPRVSNLPNHVPFGLRLPCVFPGTLMLAMRQLPNICPTPPTLPTWIASAMCFSRHRDSSLCSNYPAPQLPRTRRELPARPCRPPGLNLQVSNICPTSPTPLPSHPYCPPGLRLPCTFPGTATARCAAALLRPALTAAEPVNKQNDKQGCAA